MEDKILFLAVICFAVIGVSHLLQPNAWIRFFKLLISHDHSGAFVNGFITLPLGSLIVVFHNVWSGYEILLTIIGWGYIIKSIICFCFPAISLKSMKRAEKNNSGEFRIAGVFLIVIAATLSISAIY
jgi:uncharacterized protein YjeT (DUF2065 family)